MLFITGDTHGEFERFSGRHWLISKTLTHEDYVIIAGDFGLIFDPVQSKNEIWWTKWLQSKPWTTLFIDGNHENFDKLYQLPLEEKFGGIVGKVADNIFHLRRGEIYEICNKKILTFGGAKSIDKIHRRVGVSWWEQEIPSYAEFGHCVSNIEKHNNKVDFIITHTCPSFLHEALSQQFSYKLIDDPTTKILDYIFSICEYTLSFCGHMHIDFNFQKHVFLYKRIISMTTDIHYEGKMHEDAFQAGALNK